jgi:hypothetical protein
MNNLPNTIKVDPDAHPSPRSEEDESRAGGPLNRAWLLRVLVLSAFTLTVAVVLTHRPWDRPERGDEAIWDYVAQSIVRGQVPYRDVVEIKSPLSAYLSAAAIVIGRAAGVKDVFAVRLLNVLMVGLVSVFTFLVAATYLRSLLAASIAFLIPLAPWHFAEWMVTGTEPKLPMILFGLISLLLIAREKPFWAGCFSMLSCLCWQPGLLFTGVAVLAFSKYLTRWRDLAAVKVLIGALVPLLALVLYFYSIGVLGDFWTWTVEYNFRVYAPETAKGLSGTVAHLWSVCTRVFGWDLVLVGLSVAGLIWFVVERIKASLREDNAVESPHRYRDAMAVAPAIYVVFCVINFQSGPDLIPLFPFMGMFGGWFAVQLGRVRFGRGLFRRLPGAALVVLVGLIIFRSVAEAADSELTLQEQEREFAKISKLLEPDDNIYVHGAVEILVLLNKPNLNPYIYLDRGKDKWIAKRNPGGFRAILEEMESSRPKVVAISRIGKVVHRVELRHWVEEHYDQIALPGYDGVYLRRQP